MTASRGGTSFDKSYDLYVQRYRRSRELVARGRHDALRHLGEVMEQHLTGETVVFWLAVRDACFGLPPRAREHLARVLAGGAGAVVAGLASMPLAPALPLGETT
jgi:hypothetical protein